MNTQAFLVLPYVNLAHQSIRIFNRSLDFSIKWILPLSTFALKSSWILFTAIFQLSVFALDLYLTKNQMSLPKSAKKTLARFRTASGFSFTANAITVESEVEEVVEILETPKALAEVFTSVEDWLEELKAEAKSMKIKGWNFYKDPEKLQARILECKQSNDC